MGKQTKVTKKAAAAYIEIETRKGGFSLRRHHYRPVGLYVASAGFLILFAVILPAICWWILLGLALIFAGIMLFCG